MPIVQYLAMTAAEMATASSLPPKTAWMACHFSPYSTGLSNLPEHLPEDCLLILNDRTAIRHHSPGCIAQELRALLNRFHCPGLLLDFQTSGCAETAELVQYLTEHLDCPLGITPPYHIPGKAAVFLPDVPTNIPISYYLKPWAGQDIWLETALEGQRITLTRTGAAFSANTKADFLPAHQEPQLHCHYHIRREKDALTFHTWRTREDLSALLDEAESLGVSLAVGLYQELRETCIDAGSNL